MSTSTSFSFPFFFLLLLLFFRTLLIIRLFNHLIFSCLRLFSSFFYYFPVYSIQLFSPTIFLLFSLPYSIPFLLFFSFSFLSSYSTIPIHNPAPLDGTSRKYERRRHKIRLPHQNLRMSLTINPGSRMELKSTQFCGDVGGCINKKWSRTGAR